MADKEIKKEEVKDEEIKREPISEPKIEPEAGEVKAEEINKSVNKDEEAKRKTTAKIDDNKVILDRSLNCFIGGKYYKFKAGKTYKVNENVKKVLIDREVLSPTY